MPFKNFIDQLWKRNLSIASSTLIDIGIYLYGERAETIQTILSAYDLSKKAAAEESIITDDNRLIPLVGDALHHLPFEVTSNTLDAVAHAVLTYLSGANSVADLIAAYGTIDPAAAFPSLSDAGRFLTLYESLPVWFHIASRLKLDLAYPDQTIPMALRIDLNSKQYLYYREQANALKELFQTISCNQMIVPAVLLYSTITSRELYRYLRGDEPEFLRAFDKVYDSAFRNWLIDEISHSGSDVKKYCATHSPASFYRYYVSNILKESAPPVITTAIPMVGLLTSIISGCPQSSIEIRYCCTENRKRSTKTLLNAMLLPSQKIIVNKATVYPVPYQYR